MFMVSLICQAVCACESLCLSEFPTIPQGRRILSKLKLMSASPPPYEISAKKLAGCGQRREMIEN